MMNGFIRRLFRLEPLMGDMIVSGIGCFVFLRAFRVVAMGQEGPGAGSSMCADGRCTKPLEGFGAALFLPSRGPSLIACNLRASGFPPRLRKKSLRVCSCAPERFFTRTGKGKSHRRLRLALKRFCE